MLAFGLRLGSAGKLDQATEGTLFDCIFGIVLVLVVTPWGYVLKHYLKTPGEQWRKRVNSDTGN